MIELGKIEATKGNTTKARELFNKILKINPDDVPTLYELGKLDETLIKHVQNLHVFLRLNQMI